MARSIQRRRFLSERLEHKRLLAADGYLNGDFEPDEIEPTHYQADLGPQNEHDDSDESSRDGDDSHDSDHGEHLELHAQLLGDSQAQGDAEYKLVAEHGAIEQKLEVEVEDAPVGTVWDVAIDGVVVGQLTVNDRGNGRLRMSSRPDDNDLPLPANFPEVKSTSQVTVGPSLAGSFDGASVDASDDGNGDDSQEDYHDDHGEDSHQPSDGPHVGSDDTSELEAILRGDGTARGMAEFEIEAEHGGPGQEFSVRITGAEASMTYEVTIDGLSVGQLTTNEFGSGTLKFAASDDGHAPFPEGFPVIQSGSSVKVGAILSGDFVDDDHRHGDVNDDHQVDDHDIDDLYQAIANASHDDRYDVDGNHSVNAHDANYLVEVVLASVIGDANLDGIFDSADLIEIFQAGEYEDGVSDNSAWRTGDWNGDGECDSADLVYAMQLGHYR